MLSEDQRVAAETQEFISVYQSSSVNCLQLLTCSLTQVHTSGQTTAESLRFDLERSVDQQEAALLLQEVEIHICT